MKKKYLLTSALPYINGVKHLGNLLGSMLPPDIFARFLRQQGHLVTFICGTDEHGVPAEIAASQENIPIQEYCDKLHKIQKKNYEDFDISFDFFGRTSSKTNHSLTQEFFLALHKNGYIKEKTVKQLFDEEAKLFLSDRFVEGECPHCGFTEARGDQCDNCSTLLDPIDLKNPKSKISGTSNITHKETKHLFLDLPKLTPEIEKFIEKSKMSKNAHSIAKKWLSEGLKERCITRDLNWGVCVPLEGYEDKVFYVWFDAPIGYISITKDFSKGDWWSSNDVELIHFMGKDNVPFHTTIWPAMLIGSDLGYKTPDGIKAFEFLNYEGGQFSTSRKRGVFLDKALADFPADYWRYYLMSILPESKDSDFTFDGFSHSIDALSNSLGNFIHRTTTFLDKHYDSTVPKKVLDREEDKEVVEEVQGLLESCSKHLYNLSYKQWFSDLLVLFDVCDKYISLREPWKEDDDNRSTTMHHAAKLCSVLALVSYPLIPSISKDISNTLNLEGLDKTPYTNALSLLDSGHKIQKTATPLISKIEPEKLEMLKQKYSTH